MRQVFDTETNLVVMTGDLGFSTLTLSAFCLESFEITLRKWSNPEEKNWESNDLTQALKQINTFHFRIASNLIHDVKGFITIIFFCQNDWHGWHYRVCLSLGQFTSSVKVKPNFNYLFKLRFPLKHLRERFVCLGFFISLEDFFLLIWRR